MRLEINLEKIALTAKEKATENKAFSVFLQQQNTTEIDAIVHKLSADITPKISCTDCGNCCKNLRPIASAEALSPFVEPSKIEAYKYLESFTCKNLKCNTCSVYETRPLECREYPYLHRDNFAARAHEIRQNYAVCPIVFNVFNSLKASLKWKNS